MATATSPAPPQQRRASAPAKGGITGAVITTYLARLSSMIAYVVLLPFVLSAFGAEQYGLYMLTVALGALFQQDLGIGDATTRFIGVARPSGDIARMRSVASASNVFYLAAALLLASATAIAFAFTVPNADFGAHLTSTAWALAILGVANVFLLLVFSANRQVLAGVGRLGEVNYLLIGLAAFRVVFTLLVCWADLGIVAVAMVDVVGILCFGIATYVLRRLRAPQITARFADFRWDVFRELFHVSSQLMVLGIAGVVIMQVGGILTALLLPIGFTAMYAAGQRIYLLVKEVTGSLAVAVLPTASMRHGGAAGAPIGQMYLRGTSLANMLMTLVLVPVVIFMPQIMQLWVGEAGAGAAAGAAVVAQILVLSMFANNNHLLAVPILTAQGSLRGFAVLHTIWAVSGTLLAVALGSSMGLAGIALGLAVPIVLLEPIYIAVALRRLDLSVRDFAIRCLLLPFGTVAPLAAGLIAVSLLDLSLPLIVLVTLLWVAAALTVYYFLALDKTSRAQLRSALPTRSRAGHALEESP
ncbi:oligosaccharide flippase family protein [Microbacterium sp. zg-YB36]|uniref:oligosaccharide flippase family protein n=1 Tax=Microbacterium sp. zg-YB36 TaxID=2969407 RepID=UPI00214C2461|nr:oligosaccharide flippase family protein [Microbacterium sp. zg-YB36]MDL5352993.1 oligosaccharide flippase family protein [Microbacterium sp. zg-YB36]